MRASCFEHREQLDAHMAFARESHSHPSFALAARSGILTYGR
jgi:hypothetical protein